MKWLDTEGREHRKQAQAAEERKGKLIGDPTVPYHVVLPRFPYQEDMYRAFKSSPLFGGEGPSVFALPWSRRAGKDITGWQCVVEACMTYNNFNVLVTHETFEACRLQFLRATWAKRTPDDPRCFLGLIPKGVFPDMDELPPEQKWQASCVNYNQGTLTFPNGSSVTFKGAKNPKVRGREINMWLASEYAFYDNHTQVKGAILPMLTKRTYAEYDPSLGAAPPCGIIIYTSTGNGMNDYSRIALGTDEEMQKRGIWSRILPYNHPDLVNHDGEPIVTDEDIDELRQSSASNDIEGLIRREFLITFESAIYGSVFGDQLELMVKQERIADDIPYNNDLQIYTGWDLGYGGESKTVVLCGQEVRGVHHLLREFAYAGKVSLGRVHADIEEWRRELGTENVPARWGTHYLPWDAARSNNHTLGDDTQSVEYLLGVLGLTNLYVTKRKNDKKKAPLFLRNYLPDYIRISRRGCPGLVAALAGYSYKADKNGVFGDKPDTTSEHSHYIDALDSYMTGHQEFHGRNLMELADKGLAPAPMPDTSHLRPMDRFILGERPTAAMRKALNDLRRLQRNQRRKAGGKKNATRSTRNGWMRR